jgi:hypothetical protein
MVSSHFGFARLYDSESRIVERLMLVETLLQMKIIDFLFGLELSKVTLAYMLNDPSKVPVTLFRNEEFVCFLVFRMSFTSCTSCFSFKILVTFFYGDI